MNTIKEYIKTLLKLAINNNPEVLKVIRNSKAVIANYRPDQKRIKGRFAYEGGNDLKVLYRKDNTPIDVTYYKNDIEEIPAFNIRDLRFIGRSPESVRKDEIKDAVLLGMEKIYATNKISNIEAAITNNGLKEMVGEIFKNKDEKEYSLLKKEIIAKVQNIFEESIPILKHNELKNPNLFDNQIIHRFALPIQIGQNEFLTMLTVKERADFEELNIDEFSIYDLNSKKQTSDRYSSLDDSTDGRSQMSIYSVDDLKQFVNTELHNKYGENRNINIDNDKWITIHPNGEDSKGRPLLLKDGESPKEAIERSYKSSTKLKESSSEHPETNTLRKLLISNPKDEHYFRLFDLAQRGRERGKLARLIACKRSVNRHSGTFIVSNQSGEVYKKASKCVSLKEATNRVFFRYCDVLVSIHAPARGATVHLNYTIIITLSEHKFADIKKSL